MTRGRLFLVAVVCCAWSLSTAQAQDSVRNRLPELRKKFVTERALLGKLQLATDAQSALDLGRLLKSGLAAAPDNPLRESDEAAAEQAFERAIAAGRPPAILAMVELADLLSAPDRSEADLRRAVDLYRSAATAGNSDGAIALAALYEQGRGVPPDLGRAKTLYAQALLDEEPDAAFGLARLATTAGDETGAKSFTAQGIVFLRLRAERSATAASALATRYATGDGLPRDLDRAKALFEKAITLGQTTAAVSLGTKLVEGTALPADPATGKALLVEAEAAGSVDAARTLLADAAGPQTFQLSPGEIDLLVRHLEGIDDIPGMLVAQGLYRDGHGVKPDPARSAALLDHVMHAAHAAPAQLVTLGRRLRDGRDMPADPQRAFEFFAAAAEAGVVDGMIAAADLALDERLRLANVDMTKVKGWLERAAQANSPDALVLLGDVHRSGVGVPKSAEEAARYYDLALASGATPLAMERRALLYLDNARSRSDGLRAIALLERAADLGHAPAMDVLGRQYEYGTYIAKDPALAERWMSRAGALGYLPGLIDLGELYATAPPPFGSSDKAYAAYQRAWQEGSSEAGLRLGRILRSRGQLAEAKAMLRQAVDRGSGVAAIELASMAFAEGGAARAEAGSFIDRAVALSRADTNSALAVAQAMIALPDKAVAERGIKILMNVDAAGDGAATRVLADLYVKGDAGSFDRPKAELWARKAAERGSVQPLFNLASSLVRGDHGTKDVAGGVALLEEAHRLVPNHMQTIVTLARLYQMGSEGVRQDVKHALALLEQAAEFGSITAQVMTARAYAEGSGTPRDPGKAIQWFTRAADQGSLEAMMELGRYYAAGEGVKLDAERAFGFFYRAAKGGSVEAMVEVGKSMLVGYGTLQDIPSGVEWLEEGAQQGSVSAMYDLFQYYSLDDPDIHDTARALKWINAAAANGSAEAAFRMALLYRDGDLVPQSDAEMKAWLGKAAKAGHNYSAKLLDKMARAENAAVVRDDDPDDNE